MTSEDAKAMRNVVASNNVRVISPSRANSLDEAISRSYLSIFGRIEGARDSPISTSRGRISLISRISLFVRIPASWNSRARLSVFLAAFLAAS